MSTVRLRKIKYLCHFYAQHFFQKYLFTFNTLLLLFLTFQSTAFVLLSTYVQQRTDKATGKRKTFTSSHFLFCVEFTKLLLSLVWCAVDVRRRMREGPALKVPTQDAEAEGFAKDLPLSCSPLYKSNLELHELDGKAGGGWSGQAPATRSASPRS
ncbi:unnamed protein product [Phytomonas sp. Hart1]|nr:unnamed protein product [Phytomonas sp. Hart1]|eukprot:CCW70410.1 unnamed protein product [Phytomonas sp. isolate Hart1]